MLLPLALIFGLDPILGSRADVIPELVPTPLLILSEPERGRLVRGDFEVPDEVLLVFTDAWPSATEEIARQVLASGTRVVLLREIDSSGPRFASTLRRLGGLDSGQVELLDTTVDTPWVRDWGPIQVGHPSKPGVWLDADYDDDERQRDDLMPPILGVHYRVAVSEFEWPLDGGAFISNGQGLCALTLEYLDAQGITADDDDLGRMLRQLGCKATAVIPTLVGEDTKHADMIAQFVGPDRLMFAEIIDEAGTSEDVLRLAAAELGIRRAAAALGLELDIVHIPTPPHSVRGRGRERIYSYVNGLRLGDRYLMPTFPELDESWNLGAWSAIQDAQGAVPVVAVDASEIIALGGAIHCMALGLVR